MNTTLDKTMKWKDFSLWTWKCNFRLCPYQLNVTVSHVTRAKYVAGSASSSPELRKSEACVVLSSAKGPDTFPIVLTTSILTSYLGRNKNEEQRKNQESCHLWGHKLNFINRQSQVSSSKSCTTTANLFAILFDAKGGNEKNCIF